MRRSPTDHGYERWRRRTRRHVDSGDLDGLASRRWRGCRDGATVLGGGGGHGEREDEGNGVLRVGLEVELACALALLSFPILGSLGAIDVVGVHLLVLLFLFLCELLPVETFFGGQGFPLLADGLGEVCLALFLGWAVHRGGSCFVLCELAFFAASPAEEDERVLGALDVVLVALLGSAVDIAAYGRLASFVGRGDGERRCGRGRERR